MQVLYQGAESIIRLGKVENHDAIIKERISKGYRIKQLDDELRKLRTRKEVKLLTEVGRLGIPTPKIISVDEKNYTITMEYIKGEMLKDYLNSAPSEKMKSICMQLGKMIGKLHSNNITHGDMTTSNMIIHLDKLYFIDFSLGEFTQRTEDKAVDMRLLKKALKSTHFKICDDAWQAISSSYSEEYKDADAVFNQLKEIERRARYVNREAPL